MALVLATALLLAKVCSELWIRPQVGFAAGVAAEAGLFAAVMPVAYWAFARFERAEKPVQLRL